MKTRIPTRVELLEIYRRTALIRGNDDRFIKMLKAGRIAAPYYSPRGQEIIPSALSVLLTDKDYICTIYRGIHDMLAKGMPVKELWAEVLGKVGGTCKGKGGPMHLTYPAKGIMVTTGIVGSSMPIANGLAWASMLDGSDTVTVAYFGDGASNIGTFHEALNLAAIWNLPVIFVCQNNTYGEHTRYAVTTKVRRISDRAPAYAMPSIHVDGNNPIAMYGAAHEAIERARNGNGPTLIEAMTFRFMGHVYGDDDSYMDRSEKAAALAADPVVRFRSDLLTAGTATNEELTEIEASVEAVLDEAVEFGMNSPPPDLAELRRDVYETEVL
jgi:pyruvate dehydrogenase E1 component alpha subunit